MKVQLLALSAILSLAAAQVSVELPCATACIASAVSAAGCAPNDQACQCGPTQSAIGNYAEPCLLKACPATELGSVLAIGQSLCAQYSAGLTGSVTTTSMSTMPASTTATTTVGGVSSTVVVVTTSSSSSSGTATTSSASSGSTGSGSSSAVAVSGSSSVATSASGTSSAAATSASKAAAAAGMVVNGMGGLAAAFLGVVAAL